MSGGHFDYQQYRLNDIADELKRLIETNHIPDEYGYSRHFNDNVIEVMKRTETLMRIGAIYVQRIDWLVSGDDDEKAFYDRLRIELMEFENDN